MRWVQFAEFFSLRSKSTEYSTLDAIGLSPAHSLIDGEFMIVCCNEPLESHTRPRRLQGNATKVHYLVTASWRNEDKIAETLLGDVDGEGGC